MDVTAKLAARKLYRFQNRPIAFGIAMTIKKNICVNPQRWSESTASYRMAFRVLLRTVNDPGKFRVAWLIPQYMEGR